MDAVQMYGHVRREHKKKAALGGISKTHDWLHENRPADHVHCRTCGGSYSEYGDGYDGECPSCADATYLREEIEKNHDAASDIPNAGGTA